MSELLPYLITHVTLALTGFTALALAIALVSARRSRPLPQRRGRNL